MNAATGSALIHAPAPTVRAALLTATALPEWNPAFSRVDGPATAAVDEPYELETIMSLRGSLAYTRIDSSEITMVWRIPMLRESGTWLLTERDATRTFVTHTVERHGPLAAVIAHTLATLPRLRLDRLQQRVATTQPLSG